MRAITKTLILATLLLGCATEDPGNPNDGGQFGEETSGCEVVSETPLGLDEANITGGTAQDLIDATEGTYTPMLTWSDATQTVFTVTVSGAANPRLLEYAWQDNGSGIEPAFECEDTVAIDITLSATTDDGQLAESWSTTLQRGSFGDVWHAVELDAVAGTFDAADWTTKAFDDVWADLELNFDDTGLTGKINGYGESSSGTGPDGTVSLEIFEIATFGDAGS